MSNDTINERVTTSHHPEWIDPRVTPAPSGSSVWLLTEGEVAVRGVWTDDGGFLAWCPFPRKPAWLETRALETYYKNSPLLQYFLDKAKQECSDTQSSETNE